MARFRKPFFRSSRGLWYVWHDGKQVNLGPDETAAFKSWHELTSKPKPVAPVAADLVVAVVDQFLDHVQQDRAGDTYRWYKDRLELFCNFIPATLRLDQLKPFHVQRWIDSFQVSSGTKRNYCRAIMRAMRWAEEQGYVQRSPLAHFRKPRGGKKEQVVSVEEFQKILENTADQEFRDLCVIHWEVGCRPQESLRVEARHVDLGEHPRWVFPASEAKGGKLPRVIYLTPKAVEITKRLMERYPEGPLFRNTDGRPFTPDATNCRFQTLKRKLGVKYSLYALRHSWINRKLIGGVDAFTVAILAGHSDPSMLAKHYAHLSHAPAFLASQAVRASA